MRPSTPKKQKFRLQAKRLFLTYPQCPVDATLAMILIRELEEPKIMIVASEAHKDGTPHLHVYIEYERKKDITSPTYYDLQMLEKTYHGNYQAARKHKDVMKVWCAILVGL